MNHAWVAYDEAVVRHLELIKGRDSLGPVFSHFTHCLIKIVLVKGRFVRFVPWDRLAYSVMKFQLVVKGGRV